MAPPSSPSQRPRRSLWPLIAIFLITLTPLVLAALLYFVPALGFRPVATTNYGALVDPQREIPDAAALSPVTLDGEPFDLHSLRNRWILISAGPSACPESCVEKLFILRNSHASQGKDVHRVTRVWFVLDDGEVPQQILEAYQGTHMLRVDPARLAAWLAPQAAPDTAGQALLGPMWVVDPHGNLMMAFPPDADPLEVRDDLRQLLRASRIG